MTTPIASAEKYLNLIGSSFTVGTSPSTWVADVIEGGLTHTYDTDEMTSTTSAGAYEDVKTTYKYEGDITIAYNATTPPPYVAGDIFHVDIKAPTGGVELVGNWRFNSVNDPLLTIKGGYKQKFKLTNQGAIVRSIAT